MKIQYRRVLSLNYKGRNDANYVIQSYYDITMIIMTFL